MLKIPRGGKDGFIENTAMMMMNTGETLQLEGETEHMSVCTKEWERYDS